MSLWPLPGIVCCTVHVPVTTSRANGVVVLLPLILLPVHSECVWVCLPDGISGLNGCVLAPGATSMSTCCDVHAFDTTSRVTCCFVQATEAISRSKCCNFHIPDTNSGLGIVSFIPLMLLQRLHVV